MKKQLEKAANELSGGFDSLLIIGTSCDGDITKIFTASRGNEFANHHGAAKGWLLKREAGCNDIDL